MWITVALIVTIVDFALIVICLAKFTAAHLSRTATRCVTA
jgi:hypothetical protein